MALFRPSSGISRYVVALTYRDFLTMWTANLASGAAAWALIVARAWVVYEISDSSLWVGLVTFAAMAPRVLVTPVSGYLADRFNRRNVVSSMMTVNMASNLVLGLIVVTDVALVWHIVMLSLINGSAQAAQTTGTQALIPNLVRREHLLNAIAMHQATIRGSRLLGPAAIAPLMVFVGPGAAFFLCTGFYAIALVQVLRVMTVSTGEIDASRGLLGNLIDGALYIYRTPALFTIMMLALFHCTLTMSFESLLPALSTQRLGADAAGVSYMMMGVGFGALISTVLVAGTRSESTRGRVLLNAGILSGLSAVILAFSTNVPTALLGAACMGASQAAFMTITHTMIQTVVPDRLRGRVSGMYTVHVGGMMAVGNLVNGFIADYIDAALVLMVSGIAFSIVMVVSWQMPYLRGIYRHGTPGEALATPSAAD